MGERILGIPLSEYGTKEFLDKRRISAISGVPYTLIDINNPPIAIGCKNFYVVKESKPSRLVRLTAKILRPIFKLEEQVRETPVS